MHAMELRPRTGCYLTRAAGKVPDYWRKQMAALPVKTKAPDFELRGTGDRQYKLSDLLKEGKPVILAFFPAAWSPPCTSELSLFQEVLPEFERLGARILGISVDSKWSQDAWAEKLGLTYPLLSDFHPKGEAAKKYGVLRHDGASERALFIVAPDGTIRYSYVSPILENPGADRLLEELEKAHKG
jgi:peroxiredoxin